MNYGEDQLTVHQQQSGATDCSKHAVAIMSGLALGKNPYSI